MEASPRDRHSAGAAIDRTPPVELAAELAAAVTATVRGKPEAVRLALVALLSGGHLLVEDLPGTGKTLLAKTLAAAIGGRFGRVQCTPDLLPTDITGTSVFVPDDRHLGLPARAGCSPTCCCSTR